MESLVIMGEYDDIQNLVRDGSKRLKEATEDDTVTDEDILSANRPRGEDGEGDGGGGVGSGRRSGGSVGGALGMMMRGRSAATTSAPPRPPPPPG